VRHLLHRFISDKTGVTAIEYALVASMIVLVIIVAEVCLARVSRPNSRPSPEISAESASLA